MIRFKKNVIIKLCLTLFLCYYIKSWTFSERKYSLKEVQGKDTGPDYIMNTPGCTIPNYIRNMKYFEAKSEEVTCGQRAVHISHVSDHEIIFRKDQDLFKKFGYDNFSCGFMELRDLETDTVGILSRLKPFADDQVVRLHNEASIFVICSSVAVSELKHTLEELPPPVYTDFYVILKKKNENKTQSAKRKKDINKWNVLVLGMESMSRGRMYHSMPMLVKFFKKEGWLDYGAFQKVSENTNIVALLTGNKALNKQCYNLHLCREQFLFHKFNNDGYMTALGEDVTVTRKSITAKMAAFNFTDHYLSILSSVGKGNFKCYGQTSTGEQFLDYALQFVQAYKNDNFFGLFWSSSFSRFGNNGIPALFQKPLINLFHRLNVEGILENTFVLFLGDESINYGPSTYSEEGYYDSRLPGFFLWVPYEFRRLHTDKYNNLITNQNRLITYYDVNMFVNLILNISDRNANIKTSECETCERLIQAIPPSRTCESANIEEPLCTCHSMFDLGKEGAKQSLYVSLSEITKRISAVNFIKPAKCRPLSFSGVLRSHFYKRGLKTYYVIAGALDSGDVVFESVVERSGDLYRMVSLRSLTEVETKSNCVFKNDPGKEFCVCENDDKKRLVYVKHSLDI